ncbi:hypothetical protein K443DRAFT_13589 [Laccaria amethystina LaAM-08-1]|uniref:Uncharacterized protein n=1 Tax=Laccaria amethystina LaAM-08-1 TaxID=1095629 RepID=A0A0C9X7Z6_9AGAR|nr:hypothetical protein K443DRAFT_13589 [Laccaria amethystina LaAM-08-1]
MANFPEHMRIKSGTKVDVLIPSWHGERCKKSFCLGYTKGARRTCGEEVEISWNRWNFRKIVGFRTLFAKRFQEVVLMSKKQPEVSNKFSEMFPSEVINKWIKMVENWEANPKAVNPYNEPEKTTTLQDARLELAQEENAQLASGFVFKNELSRSKGKGTSKQLADLEEKRSSLIWQIQLWRPVQLAYIPLVTTLLPLVHDVDEYTNQYANPESTTLFLPSSLPPSILTLSEVKEMGEAERRLCEPQADDALSEIRCLRHIITGLWLFKKINKLQCAAHHYHTAYNALLALDPTGSWRERLRKLNPADIRGPGRDPDDVEDAKRSKGQFEPLWIWLVPRSPCERGDDQTEEEFNDTMHAEWAQTRARKSRWNEELLIIQEEMHRVLSYCEWRAKWWLEQENRRQIEDMSVLSRVSAYAHKEASICH